MPEPFINVEGLADTLTTVGTATAPGAGATLAAIAIPAAPAAPSPVYEIEVTLVMSGTRETQPLNLRLFVGGTFIGTLVTSTADGFPAVYRFRETLAPGASLALIVQAAATAGAIYTASLRATRLQ